MCEAFLGSQINLKVSLLNLINFHKFLKLLKNFQLILELLQKFHDKYNNVWALYILLLCLFHLLITEYTKLNRLSHLSLLCADHNS